MRLFSTWFAFLGATAIAFLCFERRRAGTLARLAAVTREMRDALDARSAA